MNPTTSTRGRCHLKTTIFNTAYVCTEFDNCCFSHSRVMIGGPKFKIGHVITNMPI